MCILIYHSIGDEPFSVAPAAFDGQMRYLAEYTRVVSLSTLLSSEARAGDRPTCAITFDDGYASVHDVALPILRKYRLPAALYVTTGVIGECDAIMSDADPGLLPSMPMLTWLQIKDLQRGGFTIGTHLMHHRDLTALGRQQAVDELRFSREAVEQHIQFECRDFAYPWGYASKGCAEYIWKTGYRSAVTSIHRPVPVGCDPIFLPRMGIRREYDLTHFGAIIRGEWDYLRLLHEARNRAHLARLAVNPFAQHGCRN